MDRGVVAGADRATDLAAGAADRSAPHHIRRDVPDAVQPASVTAPDPTSSVASASATTPLVSGHEGGPATQTPSGSPALPAGDAATVAVAPAAAPAPPAYSDAAEGSAPLASASPDAGIGAATDIAAASAGAETGEPPAATDTGAVRPGTAAAATSGLPSVDSTGTGAVAAPPGPAVAADGAVPASAPTPEATAPAAEAGTLDAADPGTSNPVDPGTPAPADNKTAEQPGAASQPAPGRVDLPAPVPASAGAVVGPADTAVAPARQAAAPLPQQLGGHAFALAQSAADAPGGTSTITVTVAPDDLGPITIRASFAADGTRLEFFSSTDGGREALKQALPDLRREASSSGLSASLDLGTGTPEDRRDGRRDQQSDSVPTAVHRPVPDTSWTPSPTAGSSTLDLFA